MGLRVAKFRRLWNVEEQCPASGRPADNILLLLVHGVQDIYLFINSFHREDSSFLIGLIFTSRKIFFSSINLFITQKGGKSQRVLISVKKQIIS